MGELAALPQTDLLAGLWGPTSKGRKGERRGGEVREGLWTLTMLETD